MAYTKYDATAANNTNPPPNGAPEGMVPSTVNDTIRDMMAEIRLLGNSVDDGSLPGASTPIPLTNGGTGGITNTAARSNLDVYSKAEADSNYLPTIPTVVKTSETGPTDALPAAVMPFSFNARDTLGMYSPLANNLALSAGDHTKRLNLSQTSLDIRVPVNVVETADKETTRVNQSLYSRNQVETLIANLEPIGTIKLWRGTLVNIPAGYNLCDGTNGTIDLVNKFVRGTNIAGLDTEGGDDAQTVDFNNMNSVGTHGHSGSTNETILLLSQIPAHDHSVNDGLDKTVDLSSGTPQPASVWDQNSVTTTGSRGGSLGHDHPISNDGAHNHTGTQVLDNKPVFYQLVYIQKTSIVLVPA